MYAASTFRLEAALDVGLPSGIATMTFWIAAAAWTVTAIGMAGSARALGRR
jgi:hypothetical protein